VALVHMPLGEGSRDERLVLSSAAAVVTPSRWTRQWLLDTYGLAGGAVTVAEPGTVGAPMAPGSRDGGELVCVAAVASHKGHDALVDALATMADLEWRLTCVGSLDVDPAFAAEVVQRVRDAHLQDRVTFAGPRTGSDLDEVYAGADLLVLASAAEAYGMVVTEALARGLPVVASDVGGVPEALGRAPSGDLPGVLVPPGNAAALAATLRGWLTSAGERARLRAAAAERRERLTGWSDTAVQVATVLGRLLG
jgi:glycosyltransferase involved in cell wall biosynthesis